MKGETIMENVIDVNDFSFFYGDKPVLEHVSFHIAKGEIIGLLGENGSGKTTFLDSLYGFHGKQEAILILSTNPVIDNQMIKENVSYIQDTPNLLDYLTAEQYIKFICHIEKLDYDNKKEEIMRYIDLFDLSGEYQSKLIKDYSFGMKKKIQIIGELFLHKNIILIDEPTNGLDIGMIISLKKILKQEHNTFSSTIIISSHNTQFLEDVCDRILLFNHHQIVKDIINDSSLNLETEFLNAKLMESEQAYGQG